MRWAKNKDEPWEKRLASDVSYLAGDNVMEGALETYLDFFSANALYPTIFPNVARFEQDMTAGRLQWQARRRKHRFG